MTNTTQSPDDALRATSLKLGDWMSAALDDPKVCAEMKADINNWFAALTAAQSPDDALRAALKALEPFADEAKEWPDLDKTPLALAMNNSEHPTILDTKLTVGDFHRAAEAYAALTSAQSAIAQPVDDYSKIVIQNWCGRTPTELAYIFGNIGLGGVFGREWKILISVARAAIAEIARKP